MASVATETPAEVTAAPPRPRRKPFRRRAAANAEGWSFIAPGMLFVLGLSVFPALWALVLSLQKWNGFSDPKFIGARNYTRLVTDAEVLQEILHRYVAIQRRDAISPAIEALLAVVDEVLAVEGHDVLRARDVLLAHPQLSARDALHVATMRRHGIETILTFDTAFDRVAGLQRWTL